MLGHLNFNVAHNETIAIFGPSGVGKTTLLHLIAGLDTGFQGAISGVSGKIGYVFQSPRLLPWRSAIQNLRIVAPDRSDRELADLLRDVGVSDGANLYPAQLSLGMARPVAIARALAVEPSLLLLDEPFASLDVATAARLRKMLKAVLTGLQTPTLLVTHDPLEAMELADRVLVLNGRPAEIVLDISTAEADADRISRSVAQQQA